ncbi:Protein of unknown function DUF833 [Carpediemonas membranifera]|uniref:NRDE family protein n=1 Tax=Carpediemonas membranifera TaxID=201153 RepID=A0A8J6B2P3_9EUKA|nr:Protein of unknown function DUF833 [Carpediemonas membranifera]|eukprot:KAG9394443.1 Protein of unknown function DUF833 [Carpediemonas membranifera]
MCLIGVKLSADGYIVIIANRDEDYQRSSRKMHWADGTNGSRILCGRDELNNGTWLGISDHGRVCALTNIIGRPLSLDAPSRGRLVTAYLESTLTPTQFAETIKADEYNAFTLLMGCFDDCGIFRLFYYDSACQTAHDVTDQIHEGFVTSNGPLAVTNRWPRVNRLRKALADCPTDVSKLLGLMGASTHPPVPRADIESALCESIRVDGIEIGDIGTIASTAIVISPHGKVTAAERTFTRPGDKEGSTLCFEFALDFSEM